MIYFKNDYSECVHPLILKNMAENCYEQNNGYGEDLHSKAAANLIRSYIGDRIQVDIHFLNGGTQTNLVVLEAMMPRPFDAVIAAETGHINVHETGAIEGTGHKVLAVPVDSDGKLLPEDIIAVCEKHTDCHMVHPAVVYISDTTETGGVYKKEELNAIRDVCSRYGLKLYLDGARLGCALTSSVNDVTLRDLAWITDAFTIGGTKNGAMAGEAVVISDDSIKKDFRYYMKHRGAMNAKGFVTGMQFETLFADRLYFRLAENANEMAQKVRDIFARAGIPFYSLPVSNQLFLVMPDPMVKTLSRDFAFEVWEKADEENTVVRFVTSWATRQEQVDALAKALSV